MSLLQLKFSYEIHNKNDNNKKYIVSNSYHYTVQKHPQFYLLAANTTWTEGSVIANP